MLQSRFEHASASLPHTVTVWSGGPLSGETRVQGSKNAVLPLVCMAVALGLRVRLLNAPRITDLVLLCAVLEDHGCRVDWKGARLDLDTTGLRDGTLADPRLRQVRMALPLAAGLAARFGTGRIPIVRGDPIGARPTVHVEHVCRSFGVSLAEEDGMLVARADALRPARLRLSWPTHTASHTALILAARARGTTKMAGVNAAPEVRIAARLLRKAGVAVRWGRGPCTIRGGSWQGEVHLRVPPDRAEIATLAAAVLVRGGRVRLRGAGYPGVEEDADHLRRLGAVVETMGADLRIGRDRLLPGVHVAEPFPGMYTDWSPLVAVALCLAPGESHLVDVVHPGRTHHLEVLRRMGAGVTWRGHTIHFEGASKLTGIRASCPDIRGSAAVLVAGLAARGDTTLVDTAPLYRGHEDLPARLAAIGADVRIEPGAMGGGQET